MQDTLSSLIVFSMINQFTPGPNNLMAMANAARYGMGKTFRFSLGVSLANALFLILGCLLQHSLKRVIPGIEPWMNGAICLYMVYLAWKMLSVHFQEGDFHEKAPLNSIITAFFLQFLNP